MECFAFFLKTSSRYLKKNFELYRLTEDIWFFWVATQSDGQKLFRNIPVKESQFYEFTCKYKTSEQQLVISKQL